MGGHVCPWWGGYFIDNRLRRLLHKPERILSSYLRPAVTVLDFGCGMGFFSLPMAEMVGRAGLVIAADLQQEMLDVLQKRAKRAGVAEQIRPHRCRRDELGVDDTVDFALAFWSMHEAPDIPKLLGEIYGCLAHGGTLLVAEPRGHVSAKAFQDTIDTAKETGFRVGEHPPVRLSLTVTLRKD